MDIFARAGSNLFDRIFLLEFQIKGLVGSNGILPAKIFLDYAYQKLGADAYTIVPTIFWLQSSDFFLQFACWIGVLISLFALIGIVQPVMFFLLWMLYL